MSLFEEATRGLFGVWRLAHRDPGALRFFENTPEAAWRSFRAIAFAAPAYLLLVLLRPSERDGAESDLHFALVEILVYLAGWFAFPLAAYYLATVLECLPRYCRYIVAYNWASVIQIAAFVPVVALAGSDLAPDGLAGLISLAVTLAFLWFMWLVARLTLEIDGLMAAGFVFIDILISVTLGNLAEAVHLGTW